jgi:hypothetical protein
VRSCKKTCNIAHKAVGLPPRQITAIHHPPTHIYTVDKEWLHTALLQKNVLTSLEHGAE